MIELKLKIELDPIPKMEGLKQSLQNKIVRKAISTAGRPVLRAAKSNAPSRIGGLRFSLALKAKTRNNVSYGVIGPRSHYERTKGGITTRPVRYAHLMEKGWKYGQAQPYLSTSFNADEVREEIRRLIAEGIKAAIA